jgi:hypothetical protein
VAIFGILANIILLVCLNVELFSPGETILSILVG